jgi:AhpD family alkylhydroperoxidase
MAMRINFPGVAPEPLKFLLGLEGYIKQCGLEKPLIELVKMRASQINGCAYCLDMHSKDARAAGETEQRLYLLNAWREAPFYSDREKAALEWTETLTQISAHHVSDELFQRVRAVFSEKEVVDLTYAVMAINAWNRLAISMKSEPGHYKPAAK